MKILHVYSGNLYGGIETLLATLARHRAAVPELSPSFALCFPGRLRDELTASGATVHDLGAVRFRRPWTVLQARKRLRWVLQAERPDAVVCHACWAHAVFAPEARRNGRPVVFWMHDAARGVHWVERLASRTPPELVLANSHFTASTLPVLFPTAPFEVIACPVAASAPPTEDRPALRAAVRRALGTPEAASVIIQVARMERWKGQTLLIEALGRLRERRDWVAWFVGGAQRPHEQAYLDELWALAEALGVADRVRFTGQRADVPRLLAASDLFCQPNTGAEPFGISVIEALDAGLPVVAVRLGGVAEILADGFGVLVPADDPPAMARALAALLDDAEARARLGASGPARARQLCDPPTVIRRLHEQIASQVGTEPVSHDAILL